MPVSGRRGRDFEGLDHEAFDRPRRRTRPRTKERPTFDDAVAGVVVVVDRGRFTCELPGSGTTVTAMKSRPLGRKGVVVGDPAGPDAAQLGAPDGTGANVD